MFEYQVLGVERDGRGWFVTLACNHRIWSPVEVKTEKWPCTDCGLSWLEAQKKLSLNTDTNHLRPNASGWSYSVPDTYHCGGRVVCWDWDCASEQVGNYVLWSDDVSPLLGGNEIIDMGVEWWLERVHPNERERVMAGVHAAIAGGGRHWSDKYLFRRADGCYAIVMDEAEIMRNKNGVAVRMIGQMHEVTAMRRTRCGGNDD